MKEQTMFIHFIADRKSWLLFFLAALGVVDVLIWIDKGVTLSLNSLLYLNGLLVMGFALFFVWRFFAETAYLRSLQQLQQAMEGDWQELLPKANYTSDQMINDVLRQAAESYSRNLAEVKAASLIEADYTAAWVHEVKAPLTAMKLTIDANRENPAIRKIESEWLRLHLMLEQQLYISRLPTMEADYVIEEVDAASLVVEEVRELASWCLEKNIGVDLIGEELNVRTDRKWCRFIIRQLMTNAVKYSQAGSTIRVETSKDNRGHVVLSVMDEGQGIPAHEMPRIFDKGFTGGTGRLHNAATGLGLYLAKTVAEKMGIAIAVDSSVGKGTAMRLQFPTENEFDQVKRS
ncbi:sensor histidine kinase [Sporosarcina cyprini]|uniref:sensor histidine kinase n=1 Tax=Sporosarcina cyprini TaxID=2910523 RepID=UPI001EDF3DFD|nr:sensor histidine kinase [Sporosarcina cyprini]MCG3087177.1 sensor histidine kinase [Sporosarcina cyprini]